MRRRVLHRYARRRLRATARSLRPAGSPSTGRGRRYARRRPATVAAVVARRVAAARDPPSAGQPAQHRAVGVVTRGHAASRPARRRSCAGDGARPPQRSWVPPGPPGGPHDRRPARRPDRPVSEDRRRARAAVPMPPLAVAAPRAGGRRDTVGRAAYVAALAGFDRMTTARLRVAALGDASERGLRRSRSGARSPDRSRPVRARSWRSPRRGAPTASGARPTTCGGVRDAGVVAVVVPGDADVSAPAARRPPAPGSAVRPRRPRRARRVVVSASSAPATRPNVAARPRPSSATNSPRPAWSSCRAGDGHRRRRPPGGVAGGGSSPVGRRRQRTRRAVPEAPQPSCGTRSRRRGPDVRVAARNQSRCRSVSRSATGSSRR